MAKDCRSHARATNQRNQNNQRKPAMLMEKKGILRMIVQKQGTKAEETRSEATKIMATRTRTRTKETEMEETMVRETRIETEHILD
ncbi:hypothetical protein Tco_1181209, partial [Tanacetum coccineum]